MQYQLDLEPATYDETALFDLIDIPFYAVRMTQRIAMRLGELVAENFLVEGVPPWAPLALGTIFERLALGFGEGPILVRTGGLLDSYIDPRNPHNVFAYSLDGHNLTVYHGSEHPHAQELAVGNPALNLPARPPYPDNTVVFAAMEETVSNLVDGFIDQSLWSGPALM